MKKLLLMVALTLALVAFVACGDEEADETTDDATDEIIEENGEVEAEEVAPAVEVDLSTAEKCVEAFLKVATDKDANLLSAICTTVSEESHQFMYDRAWSAIDPGGLVIDGDYEITDNENGTFDVKFGSAVFFQDDLPRSLSLMVTERDGSWVLCGSIDRMVKLEEPEEEAAE